MAYRAVSIPDQADHIPAMIQAAQLTQSNVEGAGKVLTKAVTELDDNKEDFYQKGVTGAENELANIKTEEELIEFQKNQMSNPNFRNDTKQDLIKKGVAKKQNIRDAATAEFAHQNNLEDRANEPFLDEIKSFMSTANSNEDIATGRKMVADMLASNQISERGAATMNAKITEMTDPIRKELGYVSKKEALQWIQDNKGGNFDLSEDKFIAHIEGKGWFNDLSPDQQEAVRKRGSAAFKDVRELSKADQAKLNVFTQQALSREAIATKQYAQAKKELRQSHGIQEFHNEEESTFEALEDKLNELQEDIGTWDEDNLGSQQLGWMTGSTEMPDGLNLTAKDAMTIYRLAAGDEGEGKVGQSEIDDAIIVWKGMKKVQLENHSKYMLDEIDFDQRRDADLARIRNKPELFSQEAKLVGLGRVKKEDTQYGSSSLFNPEAIHRGKSSDTSPLDTNTQVMATDLKNAIEAMKVFKGTSPQRGKEVADQLKNIPTKQGKKDFLKGISEADRTNYKEHQLRVTNGNDQKNQGDMTEAHKKQLKKLKQDVAVSLRDPVKLAVAQNKLNQFNKKFGLTK
jgi:hypothetical protein